MIILVIWRQLKAFVSGKKLETEVKHSFDMYAMSVIFWSLIVGWIWWSSQFVYIHYVYACPNDDKSSKCYEVKADVETDEDYTLIEKIYFNNGGYISFEYCEDEDNDKLYCYAEDIDKNGTWTIDHSKTVKVKK